MDVKGLTERFTSDKVRLAQLGGLLAFSVFSLLGTLLDGRFMSFLILATLAAFLFLTIAPIYLAAITASDSSLPKSGHISLRAAEGAGMSGIALTVAILCMALGVLFQGLKPDVAPALVHSFLAVFVLGAQAMVCAAIAAGVGLTNVLRSADVVLESPPPPKPKPAPQAYQQPADQQQAYQQQQQAYEQQQQAYQQQQQAYQQHQQAARAAAAPAAPAAPAAAAPAADSAQPQVQPPAWPAEGGSDSTGGDQSGS